jgi:hypothetical protein
MKMMFAAAAALALAVAPAAALAQQPPAGFTGPQKPGGWGGHPGNKHPGGQHTGQKSAGHKNAGHLPGYGQYPSKKHRSHPGYKSPSGMR